MSNISNQHNVISANTIHKNLPTIKTVLETNFAIPIEYRKFFSSYFILYWGKEHIIHKIESGEGFITSEGIAYKPIFLHGKSLGKLKATKMEYCRQIALSFRVPIPSCNLNPTVLISYRSNV